MMIMPNLNALTSASALLFALSFAACDGADAGSGNEGADGSRHSPNSGDSHGASDGGILGAVLSLRPWYQQKGTPNPAVPLFAIMMVVNSAVYLFNTWISFRQHRMYHPSVQIPASLRGTLAQVDQDLKARKERGEQPSPDETTDKGDGPDGENPEKTPKTAESRSLWQRTQDDFVKSQAYGLDRSSFGLFTGLFHFVLDIVATMLGALPFLWDVSKDVATVFPESIQGDIATSLVWIAITQLINSLISIPLSLYSTFVIEERHGFNKKTLGLFFLDLAKSLALSAAIGLPMLALVLKIIEWGGERFYIYVFLVIFAFQIIMLLIYPVLIAPLFNKFTPLEQGPLREGIEKLAASLRFPLRKLFVIDGSQRSAHSNAYFYGCGGPCRNMRIVLYDTLLDQVEDDEVVAIVGHELGHWQKSHILFNLFLAQVQLFLQFYLFSLFIHSAELYNGWGFKDQPTLVGLILFVEVAFTPLGPLLNFAMSALSRKFEFQADAFAHGLGLGPRLKTGLVKIHLENLGSLAVDPLYSMYHHSHPPLVERLAALDDLDTARSKED